MIIIIKITKICHFSFTTQSWCLEIPSVSSVPMAWAQISSLISKVSLTSADKSSWKIVGSKMKLRFSKRPTGHGRVRYEGSLDFKNVPLFRPYYMQCIRQHASQWSALSILIKHSKEIWVLYLPNLQKLGEYSWRCFGFV